MSWSLSVRTERPRPTCFTASRSFRTETCPALKKSRGRLPPPPHRSAPPPPTSPAARGVANGPIRGAGEQCGLPPRPGEKDHQQVRHDHACAVGHREIQIVVHAAVALEQLRPGNPAIEDVDRQRRAERPALEMLALDRRIERDAESR